MLVLRIGLSLSVGIGRYFGGIEFFLSLLDRINKIFQRNQTQSSQRHFIFLHFNLFFRPHLLFLPNLLIISHRRINQITKLPNALKLIILLTHQIIQLPQTTMIPSLIQFSQLIRQQYFLVGPIVLLQLNHLIP